MVLQAAEMWSVEDVDGVASMEETGIVILHGIDSSSATTIFQYDNIAKRLNLQRSDKI